MCVSHHHHHHHHIYLIIIQTLKWRARVQVCINGKLLHCALRLTRFVWRTCCCHCPALLDAAAAATAAVVADVCDVRVCVCSLWVMMGCAYDSCTNIIIIIARRRTPNYYYYYKKTTDHTHMMQVCECVFQCTKKNKW